ncbi:unnamed protein product [Protopolystoma xenopodis]|uniref:Uncharacterized protein n=1 Tax=Protopolystoma xenopodis TaxID=117903 RepID=A0A3S5AMT5_9PLAT|nr:unnamed protein product [Protopolystoma xenopodis]
MIQDSKQMTSKGLHFPLPLFVSASSDDSLNSTSLSSSSPFNIKTLSTPVVINVFHPFSASMTSKCSQEGYSEGAKDSEALEKLPSAHFHALRIELSARLCHDLASVPFPLDRDFPQSDSFRPRLTSKPAKGFEQTEGISRPILLVETMSLAFNALKRKKPRLAALLRTRMYHSRLDSLGIDDMLSQAANALDVCCCPKEAELLDPEADFSLNFATHHNDVYSLFDCLRRGRRNSARLSRQTRRTATLEQLAMDRGYDNTRLPRAQPLEGGFSGCAKTQTAPPEVRS